MGRKYQDTRNIISALEEFEDIKYDKTSDNYLEEPDTDSEGNMKHVAKEMRKVRLKQFNNC